MKRTRNSGHTLVEMTVVVTLLAAVMSMVARAQRPFSEMVMELQDRATTSSELHLAVDFLSTDLGSAIELELENETSFLIRREPLFARRHGVSPGSTDPGIRYSFRDGKIIRKDLVDGEQFVVATGLTGFQISRVKSRESRIAISDGIAAADQHKVTLVWRKP